MGQQNFWAESPSSAPYIYQTLAEYFLYIIFAKLQAHHKSSFMENIRNVMTDARCARSSWHFNHQVMKSNRSGFGGIVQAGPRVVEAREPCQPTECQPVLPGYGKCGSLLTGELEGNVDKGWRF